MHNVLSLIIRTKRSQDECRLIGFCAAIYILSGERQLLFGRVQTGHARRQFLTISLKRTPAQFVLSNWYRNKISRVRVIHESATALFTVGKEPYVKPESRLIGSRVTRCPAIAIILYPTMYRSVKIFANFLPCLPARYAAIIRPREIEVAHGKSTPSVSISSRNY